MRTLLWMFSVIAAVFAAYRPMRLEHDYVKEGRSVDGPFPSSFGNTPYYCYQVPDKGPCQGMFMVWFFDVVRRKCMRMFYSGCGGNENRFTTEYECVNHCGRRRRV